jgi:acetylornithine deacetylase
MRNEAAKTAEALGKSYVGLCGHMDTVSAGEGWASDPAELIIKDGYCHGLGACDMKGSIAAMIHALQTSMLPSALILCHSEETDHAGANELCSSGSLEQLALVIGEPTGLQPVNRHKGYAEYMIKVAGKEAHSSMPGNGLNASYGMARILLDIQELNRTMSRMDSNGFSVGQTINVGRIRGGDSVNKVCGWNEIYGDIRYLPGRDLQEIENEIEGMLLLTRQEGYLAEYRRILDDKPFAGNNQELLRRAVKASGRKEGCADFVTDASVFADKGIDCIIMGPGEIGRCHRPDERIKVSELYEAAQIYSRMLGCLEFKQPHRLLQVA